MQKQMIILFTCLHIGIMQSAAQETVQTKPHFSPATQAAAHFKKALNIFYSHVQSEKITEEQKESYVEVCTLIKQISSIVPASAPKELKQLSTHEPKITKYKTVKGLDKSRESAIAETLYGLNFIYQACNTDLPTFTKEMHVALDQLKRDCGGKKLSFLQTLRAEQKSTAPPAQQRLFTPHFNFKRKRK
jgi:hypothetical protein